MNTKTSGPRVNLLLAVLLALPSLALGQASDDVLVSNWSAPPYWQPASVASGATLVTKAGEAVAVSGAPVPFVALSPCRLADTRVENGFPPPYGAPSLTPLAERDFPVGGHCGVPVDATAVSFNFTVVRTQGLGYLATFPQGEAWGGTSTLNYVAGQIVANNAAIALGDSGGLTVFVAGHQADLIIDINGYYGGSFVSTVNGLSGDVTLAAGSNVTLTPSGNTLTVAATTVPGPPGPQGPAGPQGATGVQGPQGATGATGATGAQGPIGPIGPQGPQGVDGPQGVTGPQGASMSFEGAWDGGATYAALESVSFGGSSYVSLIDSNTGNSPDTSPAEWALVAQKGDTGATGATGADGPQGPQGATGADGPQGATGATGAQGVDGPQGATGATGATGAQGPIGPIGPQGPQGVDGPQGVTGAQGASMSFEGAWDGGATYAALESVSFGGSSYVSLVDGNTGNSPDTSPAEWALVAQKGDTGAPGATGADGPQGPQGVQGADGPQGATGATGAQGPDGPQGPQGAAGATGAQGPQGLQGNDGTQGPIGPIGPIGPQGNDGAQGPQGASMSFEGAWDGGATYAALESVSFGGSSYVSLIDSNTGNSPDTSPAEWALVAQKGDTGAPGATGADGPQGPQGVQGADGPQGATGATGAQGVDGPQGATGATGAQGSQGATGATGATGAQGPQGPQGAMGPQGLTGATGAQGPQGPPGPAGSGGGIFAARHSFDLSNGGGTRYFSPVHVDDASTESFDVLAVVPKACTMSSLAVRVSAGMEAGVTATITLRTGASLAAMADTAITCGVTSATPTCTGTGSVALNAADLIGLRLDYNSGSTGSADYFLFSLACD